jgi:branched-chain amino acid transport system substrate-binding protein
MSGCKNQRAVFIGLASAAPSPNVAQVAQEILDARADGGRSRVRILLPEQPLDHGPVEHMAWANRLSVTEGVVGVVGHGTSSMSLLAAPVYNAAGIPQIVSVGTHPRLAEAGQWTFALAPDDSVQGAYIGRFVDEHLEAARVTVFYLGDLYGSSLRDAVVGELGRRGVPVIHQAPFAKRGSCQRSEPENDFGNTVEAALKRGAPDVVVVVGLARHSGCIARVLHERLPHVRVVASEGSGALDLLRDAAGPAASSLFVTTLWHPDSSRAEVRLFSEQFRRIVGRAPRYLEALTFDAIMVLAHAVEAGGAKRKAIRHYLANLGGTHSPYRGVTGHVAFAGGSRIPLSIIRVSDGTPASLEMP